MIDSQEILNTLYAAFEPIKTADPLAVNAATAPSYIPPIFEMTINIMLYVAGIVLIIAILYGGLLYITSAGDEAKATKGKQAIVYGIIGTVIVLLSFVMIRIIKDLIG